MNNRVSVRETKLINELVEHFNKSHQLFEVMFSQVNTSITTSHILTTLAHSFKSRIKDPEHLRDKLIRKVIKAKEEGKDFSITRENLSLKINDLVGFRIIHLHTTQIEQIDKELKRIFLEQKWVLKEGPRAKTWDDESRAYFSQIGIGVDRSPNMYTSVHYIIKPNSKIPLTCEIQVRTLMEEVWGEVDHKINYPHKSESVSCREQIKVLARVTSSSSRLVDSIFQTHETHLQDSGLLKRNDLKRKRPPSHPLKNKNP